MSDPYFDLGPDPCVPYASRKRVYLKAQETVERLAACVDWWAGMWDDVSLPEHLPSEAIYEISALLHEAYQDQASPHRHIACRLVDAAIDIEARELMEAGREND